MCKPRWPPIELDGDLEAGFRQRSDRFPTDGTAESRARKAAAGVSLRQAREDTHALHTRWMREREAVVQAYDDGGRRLKLLEERAAVAAELPDRREAAGSAPAGARHRRSCAPGS